ncbi:unnamed protein product [Effrenium voratum]|nr:unnamed protein product [Effrenium voratum]
MIIVARLEDLEWKALQLREDNSQKAKLARTAVQRVFEIINRGQSGKAISAETMEQLYSEKLNMAENSEPVSENWVKTAYDLWDKALHKATVQQVVLAEEEFQPNSIFNTLHKMHAVIVKASTPAETEWCFTMMHDQHVADNLKHEDVTVRMLLGKRRDDQGKGYLDLLLYKKKCLQFLLDEIMGPSCLTTEEKTGVRDVLSSCNSYRAHVHEDDAAEGAGDQAVAKNQAETATTAGAWAWRAGWSMAADSMFTLTEDLVYKTKHDETLMSSIRRSLPVADVLEKGSLEMPVKELKAALEKLKQSTVPGEAATATLADAAGVSANKQADKHSARKVVSDQFLAELKQQLTQEQSEHVDAAFTKAQRLIDANITLAVWTSSEKEQKALWAKSPAMRATGADGEKYIGFVWDPCQLGETVTSPHLRLPPLNGETVKSTMQLLLEYRSPCHPTVQLSAHDFFFCFDGGHTGNMSKLMQAFVDADGKPVDKYSHRIVLCHDEDSLRERRGCVRSNQVFDVSEEMRVVSGRDLASMGLPFLRRIHFSGTNFGTKIGDIVMPNFGLAWQLPCSAKHEIHGTWRKAVGGVAQGDDNAGRGVKRKTADTVEPVFWHARPLKFWQEITHNFKLCALVDFACSDGVLAFACAKARIPYLGYALPTPHLEQDKENKTEDGSSSASGPLLEFHRKLQEIKKQQAEGGQ